MDLLRHIIGMTAALLFSVFGALAMPVAPSAPNQAEFFPQHVAVFAEHADVHFASRAPPLAVANIAITGDVTVMHGGASSLHGHETHVASLGFSAGLDAGNRGLCSFHGDTLVLTDGGLLPIRDVRPQMSVLSRDPGGFVRLFGCE